MDARNASPGGFSDQMLNQSNQSQDSICGDVGVGQLYIKNTYTSHDTVTIRLPSLEAPGNTDYLIGRFRQTAGKTLVQVFSRLQHQTRYRRMLSSLGRLNVPRYPVCRRFMQLLVMVATQSSTLIFWLTERLWRRKSNLLIRYHGMPKTRSQVNTHASCSRLRP